MTYPLAYLSNARVNMRAAASDVDEPSREILAVRRLYMSVEIP